LEICKYQKPLIFEDFINLRNEKQRVNQASKVAGTPFAQEIILKNQL